MTDSYLFRQHKKACEEARVIFSRHKPLRQERLSGIHNPWGQAIGYTDPWVFLDLCECEGVVAAARLQLGEDILLWDSELYPTTADYAYFLKSRGEGRYWPLVPLDGAVVLLSLAQPALETKNTIMRVIQLPFLTLQAIHDFAQDASLYVVRLASASSHFERDPHHRAHQACMEERVLFNYVDRPLWLLSGQDSGSNDFVGGFAPLVPQWAQSLQ